VWMIPGTCAALAWRHDSESTDKRGTTSISFGKAGEVGEHR
jgi:hypothetical protein